ncbi:hypothetical protein BS78_01G068800 [Paspalum vaginatum]|nr:hypothetical protein BS78_01G068800 [Paspalum vaginatum]
MDMISLSSAKQVYKWDTTRATSLARSLSVFCFHPKLFFSSSPLFLLATSIASFAKTTDMSGLIDIWTMERERMLRGRGAQAFRSVASLGAAPRQGRGMARSGSGGGCSAAARPRSDDGAAAPDGAVLVSAAEKQAAAAGNPPAFVREDAFLSILVDCFGQ